MSTGLILANNGARILRLQSRFPDDYAGGIALEQFTEQGRTRIELDHDATLALLRALPPALLFEALDANPFLAFPPQDLDHETRLAELRLRTPGERAPLAELLAALLAELEGEAHE